MVVRSTAALMACLLAVSACERPTTVVEGTVRVVIPDDSVATPGMVDVEVYDAEALERVFAEKREEAAAAYPELKARVDAILANAEQDEDAATQLTLRTVAEMDALSDAAFYLTGLPAPIATASTDADGRFAVVVPAGRLALVATTSGTTLFAMGQRSWVLRLDSLPADSLRITLSNDNMFGSGCATCVSGFVPPKP